MSKKRTALEILLRIGMLFVFYEISIKIDSISLNNYYSNIYISYIILFTIIVSFKYLILRSQFEKKQKLFVMILIIAVYSLAMKICVEILYKYIKTYDLTKKYILHGTNTIYSFLVLSKYSADIHFKKLIILDAIFSLIPVALELFRRKKEDKKIGYLFERLEKFIFRFFWILVYFLACLTFSSKITYIRIIKNFGKYMLLLFAFIYSIRYYLIYRELKSKKSKRENLIVILSPNNYEFSISDHYINPLRKFKKFDNTSFIKSIIVEGRNYIFTTYDTLRYNFISLKKYENIVYVIYLNGNSAELISTETKFAKKVFNIIDKENYIICCKGSSVLNNYLKENYNYRCINKIDVKKILDVINSDKNMDLLKEKAFKALRYIQLHELKNYLEENKEYRENQEKYTRMLLENNEDYIILYDNKFGENKNSYLKYGLNIIINSFNYVEMFYILLKMSEYQTHYMALKNILLKEDINEKDRIDIKTGYLSVWRKFINIDHSYKVQNGNKIVNKNVSTLIENIEKLENLVTEKDLVNSMNQIYSINEYRNTAKKDSYTFKEICKVIADIRNDYVAHGTVSYEFARNISLHLFDVYFSILEEFEALEIMIKEDEKIKQVFERELSAIYKENNGLFLYSNTKVENSHDLYSEVLNYESGYGKIIDKKVIFNIEQRYSNKELEAGLGRKVIKGNEI